mmetsp:Transcript_22346/g.53161  ORF Transcript_22346/g.53161 Transcript_22346/m.53161 type:complete len:563 (+) Transcript_22346:104-1792(+)
MPKPCARTKMKIDDDDISVDSDFVDDDEAMNLETTSYFQASGSKPRNYITQLIFEMEYSLIQLKATGLTISKLEEMAIFIYESMSISTRNYHSVQHVFDLINFDRRLENNPIAVVAICFHDCIYYHVDGGLTQVQALLLKGSFRIKGHNEDNSEGMHSRQIYEFFASDRETAVDSVDESTTLLQMVETIFGYVSGQRIRISNDGLNEFLSALVAVRMLKNHLPMEILAQIVCCIEATIPFRQADKETGKTHMDHLYDNMKQARQTYKLELSDEDLVASVQRACLVSNSDVGNFGTSDRHWFLDNTWSLLPEGNESLRNQYVYRVDHFHVALYKMYGFFGFLQPSVVFHEFKGVPAASEMDRKIEECTKNLAFGRTYVGAKLVAMSLVSALAVLTNGYAPLSLFTGDLRAEERQNSHIKRRVSKSQNQKCLKLMDPSNKHIRASDFFSTKTVRNSQLPPEGCLQMCNQLVYEILTEGRRSESLFDTKRSPWAALLYGHLGDTGLNRILEDHTLYPMTEEGAWSLLHALPLEPVRTIFESISQQALSRTDKICEILSQLESGIG